MQASRTKPATTLLLTPLRLRSSQIADTRPNPKPISSALELSLRRSRCACRLRRTLSGCLLLLLRMRTRLIGCGRRHGASHAHILRGRWSFGNASPVRSCVSAICRRAHLRTGLLCLRGICFGRSSVITRDSNAENCCSGNSTEKTFLHGRLPR